jgi:hypothetical protein
MNPLELLRKIITQGKLLATSPTKLFENIHYTMNPAAYRREALRRLDLLSPPEPCIRADPRLSATPAINVMLPEVRRSGMTGGANTALIIACHIARACMPVRIVSVDQGLDADPGWFWGHLDFLLGSEVPKTAISLATCRDETDPLRIGANDLFLATYWTTTRAISRGLELTDRKEFLYLIQDYEPGFFEWSTNYARAMSTYDMNFRGIINEALLADYFCQTGTGRFSDPSFIERCAIFEPAIDTRYFHPVPRTEAGPRRLLFYARPGRNMLGLGYEALRRAAAHPVFNEGWEFLAIGSPKLPDLDLSPGKQLRTVAWKSFDDYARLMRESDILLCLMLSPHTSYPALEMVASGGTTVTNSFATKTPARLHQLSQNLVVSKPDVQDVASGLIEAAQRIVNRQHRPANLLMPREWGTSLKATIEMVRKFAVAPTASQG